MVKKTFQADSNMRPKLIKPKAEVLSFLTERIKVGRFLLEKPINSEFDLATALQEKSKWHQLNVTFLEHAFDINSVAAEYDKASGMLLIIKPTLSDKVENLRYNCSQLINLLESISERLPIYDELTTTQLNPSASLTPSKSRNVVFIVHGHDEILKNQVARFIEKLGLRPVLLDEEPNKGMTLIDKFKKHAEKSVFAIVLLTPDDVGYPKDHPNLKKSRARQNAILELGYFLGKLGEVNVAVLHSENVELPSNYHGVLYLPLANSWEIKLAKEMKAAGLEIDMNKLSESIPD
jgi:predicted nucleotide-binding protein